MRILSGFWPRFLAGALFVSLSLLPCSLSAQGSYALTAEELGTLELNLEKLATLNRSSRARLLTLRRELKNSQEASERLQEELLTLKEELRSSQEGSEKLALELTALEKSSRRQEELLASAKASYEKYALEQKRKIRRCKLTQVLIVLLAAGLLAAS